MDAPHRVVMVTHFSRLQFWASPDSQAPPPRSSIVEEFKGTYEKDNLVGGGVVIIIIIIIIIINFI